MKLVAIARTPPLCGPDLSGNKAIPLQSDLSRFKCPQTALTQAKRPKTYRSQLNRGRLGSNAAILAAHFCLGIAMDDRWLSVDEIAEYLGVAKDTIYTWVTAKGMPGHKVGRFWKFKKDDVDSWVRDGGAASGSDDFDDKEPSNA